MSEDGDRSARVLTNGKSEEAMPDYRELTPFGQQKAYVVLTPAERAKGFVRPVRTTYTHVGRIADMVNDNNGMKWKQRVGGCNTDTTMGQSIAETYARDPQFYTGTFCCFCRVHKPLEEFVWKGTTEQVGS